MKKLLNLLAGLFIVINASAQTPLNLYYINGSLSVGQDPKVFADNSAWIQVGKDTTKKGVLLPKVILDSISTTKRALFVYDLKDSVLYHFDGTKKVRYMTYKDTTWIKTLAGGSSNLTFNNGLTRTTDNVTNDLITGIPVSNQTITGSTVSGGALTLTSTSNAIKGKLLFGASAYDEVNDRLGVGTNSPSYQIHSMSNSNSVTANIASQNSNSGTAAGTAITSLNSTGDAISMTAYNTGFGIGLANNGYLSATNSLVIGSDAGVSTGGTNSIQFRTGGNNISNERGRILPNGRFLWGTQIDAGQLFQVNGTVRINNGVTGNTLWNNTGKVDITTNANIEQGLTVGASDMTGRVTMGVGSGSLTSNNFPFIAFGPNSGGTYGIIDYNGSNTLRFMKFSNIQILGEDNNTAPLISGTLSGTSSGNGYRWGTIANHVGGGHTPTTGTMNLFYLHAPVGTNSAFQPTSGNAQMNTLYIRPILNQSGTASGTARGIFFDIDFRTDLSRSLYRAIDIPYSSSTVQMNGIVQSGTWASAGGVSNQLLGRNLFGGSSPVNYKFDYVGVNMIVGATEGASSPYENSIRTASTTKIFTLKGISYSNSTLGLMGYTDNGTTSTLYLGVDGSGFGATNLAPTRTKFYVNSSTHAGQIHQSGKWYFGNSGTPADAGYMADVDGTFRVISTSKLTDRTGIGGDPDATEMLKVTGNILTTGTIKTAEPSANGAGVIKIGKVITGATVTVQTDKYLEVEIDGVVRKLAIVQ